MSSPFMMQDMALSGKGGRQPETRRVFYFTLPVRQARYRCPDCMTVIAGSAPHNKLCPMCGAKLRQEATRKLN